MQIGCEASVGCSGFPLGSGSCSVFPFLPFGLPVEPWFRFSRLSFISWLHCGLSILQRACGLYVEWFTFCLYLPGGTRFMGARTIQFSWAARLLHPVMLLGPSWMVVIHCALCLCSGLSFLVFLWMFRELIALNPG